jgi:hypothetical protein
VRVLPISEYTGRSKSLEESRRVEKFTVHSWQVTARNQNSTNPSGAADPTSRPPAL